MDYFNVEQNLKLEIDRIWNHEEFQKIEVLKRGYAVPSNLILKSILFVGINPSFNEEKSPFEKFFYEINQENAGNSYFKKFVEISKEINHHWAHFDLLFFRETNQNYIQTLIKEEKGLNFICKQLEISKRILAEIQPKIIVVSNTMARNFFGFDKKDNRGIWMDFDFKFDENLGTHKIINHPILNNTPVFFTSMLSGQRALDRGSFERLQWHIDYVLKKIDNEQISKQ